MSRNREEIMKRRLVVPLVGLAISFALPTYGHPIQFSRANTFFREGFNRQES